MWMSGGSLMSEGGEARTFICDVCGERLPDDVVIEHYCVEGGEARNHEAEVERVPRAPHGIRQRDFRMGWEAALDAVRCSPQDEDQACDCGAKPGQPCYIDADGPQYHALRGVPQGEDHEAGIEAAMRAVYDRWPQMWGKDGKPKTYEECYGCAPLDNEDDRAEMEVAVDAYLSRCPSPEREPTQLGTVCEQCERRTMEPVYTEDGDAFCGRCAVQLAPFPERDTERLEELIRNLLCAWLNRWEPGENQDVIDEAERLLAEFSDASKKTRVSPDHDPGRTD